jgi:hypothetical protein
MTTLHFGSWLYSCPQVKLPIVFGPTEGANPNSFQFRTMNKASSPEKQPILNVTYQF